MPHDPRFEALFNRPGSAPQRPVGLLQRALAVIAALAVFALALFFSVVVFAVVVTIGLIAWAWFWWRTRELRQAMRAAAAQGGARGPAGSRGPAGNGNLIIEGEVIREVPDEPPAPPRR